MSAEIENTKTKPSMESDDENDDEELDPRIQMELEKLNAATDGINHLETEFGEAQGLFQQMMQDATFQLKTMHQQLGKSVDKSRPYYEALKQAKFSHNQLHEAALKFEQAQSRHFNAKKHVMEAEKKVFSSDTRRIDPALQEMLNQATIEVMEASSASQDAWDKHRVASQQFEEKQKIVQDMYKTLKKHVYKSRPYFELKMTLNKRLEIQKQRLEKIQEGIQCSKDAYSDTLHNLEIISDDIHRARQLKKSALLEPRGIGVGAESDGEETISHSQTMDCIRKTTIEMAETDNLSNIDDNESTGSDVSSDNILNCDLDYDDTNCDQQTNTTILLDNSANRISVILSEDLDFSSNSAPVSPNCSSPINLRPRTSSLIVEKRKLQKSLEDITAAVNEDLKELSKNVDDSYEVITSHSIPPSPPPFDVLDGKQLNVFDNRNRTRSFTDLRFSNVFKESNEYLQRRHSEGNSDKTKHKRFGSFSLFKNTTNDDKKDEEEDSSNKSPEKSNSAPKLSPLSL